MVNHTVAVSRVICHSCVAAHHRAPAVRPHRFCISFVTFLPLQRSSWRHIFVRSPGGFGRRATATELTHIFQSVETEERLLARACVCVCDSVSFKCDFHILKYTASQHKFCELGYVITPTQVPSLSMKNLLLFPIIPWCPFRVPSSPWTVRVVVLSP